MLIQYLGHACFKVGDNTSSVVIDPYNDAVGFPPLRVSAGAAVKSHDHGDHSNLDSVTVTPDGGTVTVRTVLTAHDDEGGAKRGANLVHIFEADDVTAVHLGDLGHMLTAEQVAEIGKVDVLMVPVGGFYTIDAVAAHAVCDALMPRIIIPMHFRGGYNKMEVLSTVDDFLALFDPTSITHYGGAIEVTPTTPPQVAVLTYNA